MAKYEISSKCIACGTCAGSCPMGAIAMGSAHFEIDKTKCAGCGLCASLCPMEAISLAKDGQNEPKKDEK